MGEMNLDQLIVAYRSDNVLHEVELCSWLTKYAHSCIWQLKVRFTLEEREDISCEMLAKGLEEIRNKDMTGVKSPGGWVIKCMRNVLMGYMDKAVYHTRIKRALCEWLTDNPGGLQLRRQCLEKDKYQEPEHQEFIGYGTI